MDYPYENLTSESFQQFCQSLIVRTHRDLQCFPVAQRDGGRDAIEYAGKSHPKGFLVFQVKFRRERTSGVDSRDWLMQVLKDEVPKIQTLVPKGAVRFILVTNVPGTAHLDHGSIDELQQMLNEKMPVPAQCWWRDDLNRRLDDAWDLKWSYPELLTGPDLVRLLIEERITEDRARRAAAVRAFLKDQFQRDSEVRFKQVELQNRLLELFIDVPVAFADRYKERKEASEHLGVLAAVASSTATQDDAEDTEHDYLSSRRMPTVGAATMLLHRAIHPKLSRMVLEGAPGQGKSTITQYVCQVHRMKLLGEVELEQLPDNHRNAPVRLPFKIDLRDFSLWLGRKDPFASDDSMDPPQDWHKSLEAFLAAHVRHYCGGSRFDADDLRLVFGLSPVLLVFDGLDEVAEISRRQEVVDEIVRGANRLKAVTQDLQVVVTSRPAAFANSPGLPEGEFRSLHLESITRKLITDYASRWLGARRVTGREAAEVKKILREKLEQPHLRDLARSPMQLTILLSLIHTRGTSLPDKRTALYDSYVELFFNREAEKSPVVRDNRDVLVEVHGFLAWTLHKEAERGGDSGRVGSEQLKRLVADFLAVEGHDTRICDSLFQGVIERVVALVSRVEGTYEFEVQPLREYFAARYLYDTARYSPAGAECQGTLPDRFDALIRNFYWLNVARFYAGCFSKGELPSLVDRIQELVKDPQYAVVSHPRTLAATLLSDWVFSQHKRSMRDMVAVVTDGVGLRSIMPTGSRRRDGFQLPAESGKQELVDRCLKLLAEKPGADYAHELVGLIRANMTPAVGAHFESRINNSEGEERSRWLEWALYLDLVEGMDRRRLLELCQSRGELNASRIQTLFRARRFDCLESSPEVALRTVDLILDRQLLRHPQQNNSSVLEKFASVLSAEQYLMACDSPLPMSLKVALGRHGVYSEPDAAKLAASALVTLDDCSRVWEVASQELERPCGDWSTTMGPWDRIVESGRTRFGERWAFFHFASIACGIRAAGETCTDSSDLLDASRPLCQRARYARLRVGNPQWWIRQFDRVKDDHDAAFVVLMLLRWGSPQSIADCCERIDLAIAGLSEDRWMRLFESLRYVLHVNEEQSKVGKTVEIKNLRKIVCPRTIVALAIRVPRENWKTLDSRFLREYSGTDLPVLAFKQAVAVDLLLGKSGTARKSAALATIQKTYQEGVASFDKVFYRRHLYRPITLDHGTARAIAAEADQYPTFLAMAAEEVCTQLVLKTVKPVAEVAERDGWFAT